jgi:hypothetical protein
VSAKISGYIIAKANDSANYRMVFDAILKTNGEKKDVKKFWSLVIDYDKDELTIDEKYEQQQKIKNNGVNK